MTEQKKKKLNLAAKPFSIVETQPFFLEELKIPTNNMPIKKKKKQKKQDIKASGQQKTMNIHETKQQYDVTKSQIKNVELKDFIPNDLKSQQDSSSEEIEIDENLGEWTYTPDQLKQIKEAKRQKQLLKQQLREEKLLQKQKFDQMNEHMRRRRLENIFVRKQNLENRLGLKKIGKILYELKMKQQGAIENKQQKKEYKFGVDQDGQIQIVEKEKKKKLSKIKKSKFAYDNKKQVSEDGFQTVAEGSESEQFTEQVNEEVLKLTEQLKEKNPLTTIRYNMMTIRGWVNLFPNPVLDQKILEVVNTLSLMQGKKKILQPKKFRKRVVAGFNEVKRTLTTTLKEKQSKTIIFPINLLENPMKYGSDEIVVEIIKLSLRLDIPIIHGSNRSKLGRAFCGKFGPKISDKKRCSKNSKNYMSNRKNYLSNIIQHLHQMITSNENNKQNIKMIIKLFNQYNSNFKIQLMRSISFDKNFAKHCQPTEIDNNKGANDIKQLQSEIKALKMENNDLKNQISRSKSVKYKNNTQPTESCSQCEEHILTIQTKQRLIEDLLFQIKSQTSLTQKCKLENEMQKSEITRLLGELYEQQQSQDKINKENIQINENLQKNMPHLIIRQKSDKKSIIALTLKQFAQKFNYYQVDLQTQIMVQKIIAEMMKEND